MPNSPDGAAGSAALRAHPPATTASNPEERGQQSPHKATLHRQPDHKEHDRNQREYSLRDGRTSLIR